VQPVILDVDAFALENAYESVYPSAQTDTVLFMNVGASFTNMSIIERGVSRVVRDVFISGNTFTKAIQQQFQCDVKTAEQKKMAEAYISILSKAKIYHSPIVTAVTPLKGFYPAEEYHQHFMKEHPADPYIQAWDIPKLEALRKTYPELVIGR